MAFPKEIMKNNNNNNNNRDYSDDEDNDSEFEDAITFTEREQQCAHNAEG